MCGRYVFNPSPDFYERYRLANRIDDIHPSFNVTPGSTMPIITKDTDSEFYCICPMVWGLEMPWKREGKEIKLINSRAETLLTSRSFKKEIETQRCLIPTSGFYEWDHVGNRRLPYYFSLKNREMFSFAGIYNNDTYSIITTEANEIVCPIHNRMPVMIRREDEEKWLNPELKEEELANLLSPYPDNLMQSYSVSTQVNQVSIDTPELIAPFLYD